MAKPGKSVYACTECGATSPKWQGQCPGCGEWNTLVETVAESKTPARFQSLAADGAIRQLSEVETAELPRTPTGMDELDRVLGGGLVPGGVVLIGGDPGIGKSTLLLQALATLSVQQKVLYVSGEESPQQIALRAQRLDLAAAKVALFAEIGLEKILAALEIEELRRGETDIEHAVGHCYKCGTVIEPLVKRPVCYQLLFVLFRLLT